MGVVILVCIGLSYIGVKVADNRGIKRDGSTGVLIILEISLVLYYLWGMDNGGGCGCGGKK